MTESKSTGVLFYALILSVSIGFILAPLAMYIVWRLQREEPFLDFHGRQSLDLVITMVLLGGGAYLIGTIAAPRWLGAGAVFQWLSVAIIVVQAVLVVWGIVIAARGEQRILPISLKWMRRHMPPMGGDPAAE